MFAALQKREPNFVMRIRRRCNRSSIDEFGEFIERFRSYSAAFSGNRVGAGKIDIVDGGEIRVPNFRVKPRVIAPNVTDADYANAKFFHLATFFSNQS